MQSKHWALAVNDYEKYVAILELAVIFSIYAAGIASYDHYTWWSLALVWLYIFAIALSAWFEPRIVSVHEVRKEFWLAPFLSAFIVVLGVIIMSALPCSLLSELYHENGPLVYTGGNFVVHYYPLLRMVLFAPIKLKSEKPVTFVLHLILVYTLLFDPNKIYGCTLLSRSLTTILLAGIPFLLLTACITY